MKKTLYHPVARLAILLLLSVVASMLPSGVARAQSNEYCPVTTSETADPNIYLDYEGQRIHFCCNKCKRDFIADPDAYLADLKGVEFVPTSDKLAHYAQDAELQALNGAESGDGHDHNHDHEQSAQDSSGVASGREHTDDHLDSDKGSDHGHESESEAGHDHATGHGDSTSVIGILGKFHPVVVHFPIALVIMALIFAGTRSLLGTEIFDQMAAITVYWAAFFAVIAALLGLARSAGANFPTTLEGYFEWHRLLGLASTGLTVLTAFVAYYWRKGGSQRGRLLFRLLLVVNVIAIGVTGHLGATLVFGPNYYG